MRAATLAAVTTALPLTAHAAGDGGLVLEPDVPILVGLIILFLVLILPLNQLLFKPIFRVLDEREERIAGTRARAAQLERDAEEALERYQASVRSVREESEQERRSLLESARTEALQASAEVRGEVERDLETARVDIGSALDAARSTLRSESQEIAREAASRVLGRTI